ncbi:hypothetical protein ACPOL_0451 [Acidisarcina polymorpha]|uniref:Uncharacterized protein n=1 Tax=Acidisarcina polymorpha TaxID=2211140 RepID=A0A2Z5FSL4_9BACT|nr:hypothetical protein [Acidisarcina polymorpha]AXC09828.1 hypothetical protein ACPOL_0451 [Acidisarcina polymorpha]
MDLTSIDVALLLFSDLGQLALFLILARRRFDRSFPLFTAYILYSSLSDLLIMLSFRHVSEKTYFVIYFANAVPEFLLQLGILLEVATNVVSPVKKSLPRSALILFGFIVVIGVLGAILLTAHSSPESLNRWGRYFLRMNFTFAILRLVIFVSIMGFSQMLGIGWKNHVLQIATGFAGYSAIILVVELTHHFTGRDEYRYHLLEQMRIVGWCVALGYWSYVLAKKEVARREFNPKMASFLISIAEVAGENRAAAARLSRK